ncbi:MAG: DUF4956 domain-containing protein [bacterium]
MFDEFRNINLFPMTGSEIFSNVTIALVCGLFLAWLYRRTYRGPGYAAGFVNSIVLLTIITAVVMMVIGNNLARAFGLVGAMSIIRFRTAIKETQDIVYIFFSLAIGMAAGVGYYKIAVIATLFIGFILYLLSKSNLMVPKKEEYLLQFSFSPNGSDTPSYLPVMQKHCRHHKVINVKSLGEQDLLELSYYIKLNNKEKNSEFIRELQRAHGVNQINLYCDEEQF